MAMVSWGLLISLILMPVILSLCGPLVCTIGPRQTRSERLQAKRETTRSKMIGLKGSSCEDNEDKVSDSDDSSLESDDSSCSLDTTLHAAVQ